MYLRKTALALTAALAFASAACGASQTTEGNAPPPTATAAQQSTATPAVTSSAPAVSEALRFKVGTVGGDPFDGAQLAGKPAVLWFWAAWCPKCRAAADGVAAAQREYAGRVQFVGVAGLGSGKPQMARFVTDTGVAAFPHLSDDEGAVWQKFGVTTQEYYVLIDSTGTIVHKGPLTESELREKLAALAA
ncbi:MAG: redoxin domain-containing protein [Hamadaea sp.]|nr:redoxin domain-containing protein [Hamadaea sp.]NUR48319.1 redoxin domain-containing protein [Hamadaea sp.]NUT08577.1 redoxin domain-containing protein [Hamadaea sp.]